MDGLTFECAHCHDHKYDPIKQRDYYRFYSFFNNVPEIGEDGRVANAVPIMPAPTDEQRQRMQHLESEISRLRDKLSSRERSWVWRQSDAEAALKSAARIQGPSGASLHITCDTANEFSGSQDLALVEGVAGKACSAQSLRGKPETAAMPISKRLPLTFALWLNSSPRDRDVPLLSAIDYATNPAATSYGSGIELRLSDGEIEFRYGQRFPAYSIRVRSQGAHLVSGEWRHVALVYAGLTAPDPMRAPASYREFPPGRLLLAGDGGRADIVKESRWLSAVRFAERGWRDLGNRPFL